MTLLKTLSIALVGLGLLGGAVHAAEGQKPARDVSFSFEGPFGTFDRAQLQRGYKVYKEVCAACHSMHFMSFRNLSQPGGPGFTEEQVKVLAAEIHDPGWTGRRRRDVRARAPAAGPFPRSLPQ